MSGITDEDFLDLEYDPADSDLVCEFHVEPASDVTMAAAASRVASESSNGTWAELQVEGSVTDLSATACRIEGDRVTVAYPDALFEDGNMPQVLSCIAGNILGMKAVDAVVAGEDVETYAEDHAELRVALEKWGAETPCEPRGSLAVPGG